MKRIYLFLALVISATMMQAGITTYQFTSLKWASKVGATTCDGKTDGWTATKDGGAYSAGTIWPLDNKLHGAGVSVQTGQSGVEVTSIKEFTEVRQITFNICQNASNKGKGVIYIQVGDAAEDSIVIRDQQLTSSSEVNRDSTLRLNVPLSGKIRFKVVCTKNAIHINTVTIRAKEGGTDPFTSDSYQLVTDVKQLLDSDQIIFGAAKSDYIMGYYDEYVSKNNIAAIKGKYSADRQTVAENEAAVYTLWHWVDTVTKKEYYSFVDEIRYEQAFLVANGGSTKNKLAVWDDYVSPAYGEFGVWDMDIDVNGEATIMNMGTSLGKYMQLNNGSPTSPIFACYQNQNYEKICIYRRVKAIGDSAAIVAPMCNFGTVILSGSSASGSKTIQINANKLNKDITCTLNNGSVFTLGATTIDRDGDNLEIRYNVTEPGKYIDTLVLTSDAVRTESLVILEVQPVRTIAEVVALDDYTTVYLNPVVVTKKYDKYVFIKDATGAMLIWDATNPKTGKPYAQGLENGHQLSGVQGVFQNYYGVPELSPNAAWTVAAQKAIVTPDTVLTVDSADVCRYVYMDSVVVDEEGNWQGVPVKEKFQTGSVISLIKTQLESIVMIDRNVVQLWVVKQDIPTGINECRGERIERIGKYLRNGQLYIQNNGLLFNATGQQIQ